MQLIATFKHHISLEMCIAAIEKKGIQKENIFAIPLNTRPGKINYLIRLNKQMEYRYWMLDWCLELLLLL